MMSGVGALNMSTDTEASNFLRSDATAPPPVAPVPRRNKRFPPLNGSIMAAGNSSFLNVTGKPCALPVLNLNRLLHLETSGDAEASFGVLPHGTLSLSNQGSIL
jgi:hypothetical protein